MKRGVLIIIMIVAGICNGMVQGQTKNQIVESKGSINIPTDRVNKIFIAPKEQNLECNRTRRPVFKKQIDFSGKAPGVYLVNISEGNRTLSINKIIKN